MPLRLRLAFFGGAVVALALLLFGLLLYALLARGVVTNQDDALKTRARDAVSRLQAESPVSPQPLIAPSDLTTSTDVFVQVLASDGTVIYTTGVVGGVPPTPSAALLAQAQLRHGAFGTEGGLRLFALPYADGYVIAGQSTRVPQSNLSGVAVFLVVSAVPALVAALIAAWLVAGRALRPLNEVATTAEQIGRERDFARRLSVPRTKDEVSRVARAFNGMLSRLQDAFDSQRRFVADASHELRTPLATIQANAALLSRGPEVSADVRKAAAADIASETGRMGRLVDQLLTLARADAGTSLSLTDVDLSSLVDEVAAMAAATHPRLKFDVTTQPVRVAGDPDTLRQLVWIVLDNARRYARSRVALSVHADSGWARLVVADDGPGIAVEDRERIFDRFYRADRARAGNHAGLGLSIARWIAQQHGGRIVAGEATLGGAAFLVDLPLLRPS